MARTTFFVEDPMTRNGVLVASRAPLETILVRSNEVSGEIDVDLDDATARPRVSFQVPVDSLDTGLALMNDVMRGDRWLDASKHPMVRFTLDRLSSPAGRTPLKDGQMLRVEGQGTLEFRGVAKAVPVGAEVTWFAKSEQTARRLPGDLLHVVARFDLTLRDFGIESHLAPQSLDKVATTLHVEADLFASTERPQVGADMQQRLAAARESFAQRLLAS